MLNCGNLEGETAAAAAACGCRRQSNAYGGTKEPCEYECDLLLYRCPLVYTLLRSIFWGKYHSVHSSHPPRAAASARTSFATSSLNEKDTMDPPQDRSFNAPSRVATVSFMQKYIFRLFDPQINDSSYLICCDFCQNFIGRIIVWPVIKISCILI